MGRTQHIFWSYSQSLEFSFFIPSSTYRWWVDICRMDWEMCSTLLWKSNPRPLDLVSNTLSTWSNVITSALSAGEHWTPHQNDVKYVILHTHYALLCDRHFLSKHLFSIFSITGRAKYPRESALTSIRISVHIFGLVFFSPSFRPPSPFPQ